MIGNRSEVDPPPAAGRAAPPVGRLIEIHAQHHAPSLWRAQMLCDDNDDDGIGAVLFRRFVSEMKCCYTSNSDSRRSSSRVGRSTNNNKCVWRRLGKQARTGERSPHLKLLLPRCFRTISLGGRGVARLGLTLPCPAWPARPASPTWC